MELTIYMENGTTFVTVNPANFKNKEKLSEFLLTQKIAGNVITFTSKYYSSGIDMKKAIGWVISELEF